MTWITIWFIVYLFEIFMWAYIVYLHFEIKELEKQRLKPKVKYPIETKVIIRTKKDIVRG